MHTPALQQTLAHLRIGMLVLGQYRANIAIWNLVSVLQVLVALAVWHGVAAARGGHVAGLAPADFAAYYVVLLIVRVVTTPSAIRVTAGEVRRGEFFIRLARPVHPHLAIHAFEAAATILSTANMLLLCVPIALLTGARFDAPPAAMITATLLVLPLATAARYVLESLISTTAFRLVHIDGIRGIYLVAALFLGGQFAPIAVFPSWFATIAHALPLYWMIGYPVDLFIGRAPLADAPAAVLTLTAWTTALYVAYRLAWRRGIRHLESVGQ